MQRRWLCSAALLALTLSGQAQAALSSGTSSVSLTVPDVAANGPYILSTANNGYRGAGTDCNTKGTLAYSVQQGTSQTVNFNYDTTTYVLIGGSYMDQFLSSGDGCSVTATSTLAAVNSINQSTITSITFAPTVAVCNQFVNNNVGDLSLLAFDASTATAASGYSAYACKFTLALTLVPESASSVDPSQLFPEANAADPLPGSFLKMLAMAAVGGGLMLFMLL